MNSPTSVVVTAVCLILVVVMETAVYAVKHHRVAKTLPINKERQKTIVIREFQDE